MTQSHTKAPINEGTTTKAIGQECSAVFMRLGCMFMGVDLSSAGPASIGADLRGKHRAFISTIGHDFGRGAKNNSFSKVFLVADQSRRVIIVGASVRAAAWSALRAGLEPHCVDLFSDRDLGRVAAARTISANDYPTGLVSILADMDPAPWFFTGGLENRPRLIERLAGRLPLWGNGAAVLRRVRSPFLLAESLRHTGRPGPAVSRCPPIGDQRRWLLKPRRGAGGRSIRFWNDQFAAASPTTHFYFQEWIEGESCAALFLATKNGAAHLLGVTRQFVGFAWLNAGPFQYCGSAGPLPLTETLAENYRRLGNTLTHDFELRGLFGVDCVVVDGFPWPVEVNPRYTASMEIMEWARGQSLLARHAREFGYDTGAAVACAAVSAEKSMLAKAVFYAPHDCVFPQDGPWCQTLARPWQPWVMPEFADIPREGQRIASGEPILTMFARGDNVEECVEILQRQTSINLRFFRGQSHAPDHKRPFV
jgi:predicted ATP-grasp superfamily ATP-dependent carboligase